MFGLLHFTANTVSGIRIWIEFYRVSFKNRDTKDALYKYHFISSKSGYETFAQNFMILDIFNQVGDTKKWTSVKESTNCPYYNEVHNCIDELVNL